MKIKKEALNKIQKIINEFHNGNMSEFAREANIDKSYICDLLNNKRGIGTVFIMKINNYCNKRKIKLINFFN